MNWKALAGKISLMTEEEQLLPALLFDENFGGFSEVVQLDNCAGVVSGTDYEELLYLRESSEEYVPNVQS